MEPADAAQEAAADQLNASEVEQTVLKNYRYDASVNGLGLEQREWLSIVHRVKQQDAMMKAIITIFAWLNGAVILNWVIRGATTYHHRARRDGAHQFNAHPGWLGVHYHYQVFVPPIAANHGRHRGHRSIDRNNRSPAETPNRPKTAA